jgi:hypothetical protein
MPSPHMKTLYFVYDTVVSGIAMLVFQCAHMSPVAFAIGLLLAEAQRLTRCLADSV